MGERAGEDGKGFPIGEGVYGEEKWMNRYAQEWG